MINISFDIDGVLADFTHSFKNKINELWPGRVDDAYQPPDWHYSDRLTGAELRQAWEAFVGTEVNPFFTLRPLPGLTQLRLRQSELEDSNVSIYYTTHRPRTNGAAPLIQTVSWLGMNGALYGNTSVLVVNDSADKAMLYRALDIKLSIDDKPDTVRQSNAVDGHKAYLLDQSWNRAATDLDFYRVQSVSQFIDIVLGEVSSLALQSAER